MSKQEFTITLTEKELFILWSIACYFKGPFVTSKLKYKLATLAFSDKRHAFDKKYEKAIQERIIEMGKWLEDYRSRGQS